MAKEVGVKTWTAGEPEAFRTQLLEMLKAAAWTRGNERYNRYRKGMEDAGERSDQAYKLLQEGRQSAGQALLRRVQLEEAALKGLRAENEIELLEKLDQLGIEREWKTNDPADPAPKLLFHFRIAGADRLVTLDLTAEAAEFSL